MTTSKQTKGTRCDLPVGTRVQVTENPIPGFRDGRRYTGKVVGYDIHRSKYQIGYEYLPGKYSSGSWWAFPGEVEPIEDEA